MSLVKFVQERVNGLMGEALAKYCSEAGKGGDWSDCRTIALATIGNAEESLTDRGKVTVSFFNREGDSFLLECQEKNNVLDCALKMWPKYLFDSAPGFSCTGSPLNKHELGDGDVVAKVDTPLPKETEDQDVDTIEPDIPTVEDILGELDVCIDDGVAPELEVAGEDFVVELPQEVTKEIEEDVAPDASDAKPLEDAEIAEGIGEFALDVCEEAEEAEAGEETTPPIILSGAYCTNGYENECIAKDADKISLCLYVGSMKINAGEAEEKETPLDLGLFFDIANEPIEMEITGQDGKNHPKALVGQTIKFVPSDKPEDDPLITGLYVWKAYDEDGFEVTTITADPLLEMMMLSAIQSLGYAGQCTANYHNPCDPAFDAAVCE